MATHDGLDIQAAWQADTVKMFLRCWPPSPRLLFTRVQHTVDTHNCKSVIHIRTDLFGVVVYQPQHSNNLF